MSQTESDVFDPAGEVVYLALSEIRPSRQNDKIYNPFNLANPEDRAMAESVRDKGILEPLVVTLDGYIISGHRRYAAATAAMLESVPCRIYRMERDDFTPDDFVRLLREFNRQREKSIDERTREALVSLSPVDAYNVLLDRRRKDSDISQFDGATIAIAGRKERAAISKAKAPFIAAIKRVLEERRQFWPLSDRQIHYALLNDPPLKHASKPKEIYVNDLNSYKSLTDLLTRARLEGIIPMNAISDETRPVTEHNHHRSSAPFIKQEVEWFLTNYQRDLQQSQPHHIEIIGEKLTVQAIIKPVAQEYGIPLTIGRGYCSLPPRNAIARRFRRSGRDRLVLLILSDHDPDGDAIAESFPRSMRDDFGIDQIMAIKVALTREQVERFNLPPGLEAKVGSAHHAKFTAKHGVHVHELEALAPAQLQDILRSAINSVIDREKFNYEVEQERRDAQHIDGIRQRVRAAISDAIGDASHE